MSIYTPKIDDFVLDMGERLDTDHPNSLAVNTYPFRNGATVQHMGDGAKTVQVRTFWLGRDRFIEGQEFLAHIKRAVEFNFIHPFHGSMQGYAQSPREINEDGELNVEITFTFIENLLDRAPLPEVRSLELVDESVGDVLLNTQETVKQDLGAALGDDAKLLDKELDPDKTIMEQIGSVKAKTREILSAVDRAIASIEGVSNQFESVADSVSSSITFASDIGGRVVSTLTDATEKVLDAVAKTVGFPSVFVANSKASINELITVAVTGVQSVDNSFSRGFQVVGASITAQEIKEKYLSDQINQRAFDSQLDTPARNAENISTAQGKLINVFSSNELERSLYSAREVLNFAFQLDRDNLTALKTIALLLARHVGAVRNESATVVNLDLRGKTTPLHTVTRSSGLDERYIGKIMAMNNIQNPTFTTGEILTYEE